eukprot:TRINITY_DN7594_c0_g1_i4.p1 TRINITY_DN7594_c0_g1~~TRINITY_DN7594_c0_g1_i4.p1  ORF type:complete len:682 (-),score=227.31 TRINITY_DN7594_c0_g1_i4:88-2133(-)
MCIRDRYQRRVHGDTFEHLTMNKTLILALATIAIVSCTFLDEKKLRGVANVRHLQQQPPTGTTQPPPTGATQPPPTGTQTTTQTSTTTQQKPPEGSTTTTQQPPQQGTTTQQQPPQQGTTSTQQPQPTQGGTQQQPPQGGQQPTQGGQQPTQGGQQPTQGGQQPTQGGQQPTQGGQQPTQGGQQPTQGGQQPQQGGQQPQQGGQQPQQGGQQPQQGGQQQGPPALEVRGSACTASADCNNNGCSENGQCRCKQGFSGLKCDQSQAQVSAQLNDGRAQAQTIVNRGPPTDQNGARQIAQDIASLAQNKDRPLPADDLKSLTSQLKGAVQIDGGNPDVLKALANMGPKLVETARRDDSNFQAGANGNQNLTVQQQQQNEQQKRQTMLNASIDQIKLVDQAIKQYAANQRGNLQNGGEAPLPDMQGMKGTVARLNFGGCAQVSAQAGQQGTQPPSGQQNGTQQQTQQPAGQQQQQQGGSNCGPPPQNKSGIPDPPKDRIQSPTYKFSIQNPNAANLPTTDASNTTIVQKTASQQAYVNVPQSIGAKVGADAQFSFTASANSFVPNLNNPRISGASPVYSVGFSNANGAEVKIANLTEPVRLCVPIPAEISANATVSPTCAYIDPSKPNEIDTSIEDDPQSPSGMQCCYITHFSSFTIVGQSKNAFVLMVSIMSAIILGFINILL